MEIQPSGGEVIKKRDIFNWRELNPQPVIGVDEVGRGCLAGPVFAAAVIIDSSKNHNHFKDSKILSPIRRTELCSEIWDHHQVGIGFATVKEISQLNILWAALLAMKRAVEELGLETGHVLVDGNQRIPALNGYVQTPLIKGDQRAVPVAAASIVAKVHRDNLLIEMANEYPRYGFEKHKGYSTVAHKKAIARWGPTKVHRPTFTGVKEYL